MPNWCENVLEITVNTLEEREQVKEALLGKEGDFSFGNTVPMPESISREPLSSADWNSGLPNWYNWSTENWGTKWDAGDVDVIDVSDTELRLTFDTAWSPAEAWVKSTSEVLPFAEFTLIYSEEGMDFSGFTRLKNGEVLDEVHNDEISYNIYKMMGFSAEDFAARIIYSEDKIEKYLDDEDTDKELFVALIAANNSPYDDERLSDELLAKVQQRIAA